MKWIVRADCWPPREVTSAGTTEVTAGDIASPVQIIRGKSDEHHGRVGKPLHEAVYLAGCAGVNRSCLK